MGSPFPKIGLVQTLQESTYYKAMIVCLGCVYIRQISLMLIHVSTFSLGLYFLPDAGKLFLQYQHSTLFYEVKSLPGGKLKPKSLGQYPSTSSHLQCYKALP